MTEQEQDEQNRKEAENKRKQDEARFQEEARQLGFFIHFRACEPDHKQEATND